MVVVVVVVVAVVVVVVAVVVGVVMAAVVSGRDVVLPCVLGGTVETRKELDCDSSSGSTVAAGVEGAGVEAFTMCVGGVVAAAPRVVTVTVEKDTVAEGSVVGFGLGLIGSAVVLLGMFSVGCCDPRLEVSITAACESSTFSLGGVVPLVVSIVSVCVEVPAGWGRKCEGSLEVSTVTPWVFGGVESVTLVGPNISDVSL